ncbi:MAG TPA: glycosyltransferase family 4 protein, partial [Gammaproteobacteria bacterium]|nr:glycosyltransferase family 4 protein [Gammaproteobacteria bacterium]
EVGDYNEIVRTGGSPSEEGVGEFSSTLCLPKQNSRWWSLGGLRVLILQIRAIFMLRKVIREKHIDIIHLHFPSSSLWPVVYAGAPLIVTYHGSDVLWLNNSSQKWIVRKMHYRATFIVAVSRFIESELLRHFPLFASKIKFIHNGRPSLPVPASTKRDTGVIRILYVGDLLPVKGVDRLPRALTDLKESIDFSFTVAGAGQLRDWLEQELQASLGVNASRFLGEITPDQVQQEMLQADILVLPSRREGLPNVLLEAMACGCVIVASRAGGIPEVVKDGWNGILVDPESISSLTDGLRRVCTSGELRTSLLNNSKIFLKQYPTWSNIYDKYREVYQDAIRAGNQ